MKLHYDCVSESDSFEKKSLYTSAFCKLLTFDEPENFESTYEWMMKWHKDEIPGQKLTVCLFEGEKVEDNLLSVLRVWSSPYCEQKWLIEGLEVYEEKRRLGYGKITVQLALEALSNRAVEVVYVNIHEDNEPSIKLHESLGFELVSRGTLNSWGDFRVNNNQYKLNLRKRS